MAHRIAQLYIDRFLLSRTRTAATDYYLDGNFALLAIIDARFTYTTQIIFVLLVDDNQVSKITEQLVLSQFLPN